MSKGLSEIYPGRGRRGTSSGWVTLLLLTTILMPGLSAADRPADAVVDVRNRAREASKSMRAGDVKLEAGDVAGACQDYTRTLELLPSWWLPHLALVRCGRLLGYPAKTLLDHAMFAADARPRIPATHLQLGLTLEELGRFDEAIAAYEAALVLRKDFFQARYRLGMLKRDSGEDIDAIRHLNAVITMYPGHIVALSTLATLHGKRGHVDAALATLQRLLTFSHHPRAVMGRIGRLLKNAGREQDLKRLREHWKKRFLPKTEELAP